jgi:deoxyribodipyrimidine photo-lyase
MRSIVRFRQDLRVYDQTALYHAVQESQDVLPVFVLDQKFFGQDDQRLGLLYEALDQLDSSLQKMGSYLTVLYGDPAQQIQDFVMQHDVHAIYTNISYGHGAETRDQAMQERCQQHNIARKAHTDYLLLSPDQTPQRKVFTPFYKLRRPQVDELMKDRSPLVIETIHTPNLETSRLHDYSDRFPLHSHPSRPIEGIRERMQQIDLTTYDQTRNIPAADGGTTRISPYLRFGILSIREVWHHFVAHETVGTASYLSELGWREFWQHIPHYFPDAIDHPFQSKRHHIQRSDAPDHLQAWKEGRT